MKLTNLMIKLLSLLLHATALFILGWVIYPLIKFYFSGFSGFGDWHAGYIFADYLKHNFSLPPASWIYILKTGAPFFSFYQWFHFYLMQPLVQILGAGWGMDIYSFATLLLFFLFSYILFYKLSKNQFFSVLLTTILYFSLGVLNALMQSGFITQNATQFMLPLILCLISLYYDNKNKKYLILAAVVSGFALLGHVGISSFLILAPSLFTLFFWWDKNTKLVSLEKVKDCFIFGTVSFLVGLPAVLTAVIWKFSGGGKSTCQDLTCVARVEALAKYFNNWSLYIMIGLIILTLIWSFIKREFILKKATGFLALLGFIFVYLLATHFKLEIVSSFSTFLWPLRTMWVISLGMGAVAAALFGGISSHNRVVASSKILIVILSAGSLALVFWLNIFKPYDLIPEFERIRGVYEKTGPSFYRYTVAKYKTGEYKNFDKAMLYPEWMRVDDNNFRIDSLMHEDFGTWPVANKMPVMRAYAGSTQPKFDDWRSWWTSAETDQLGVESMRNQQRQATINQALFLIDWYAIKYFNASINFIDRDEPYAPFMFDQSLVDRHEEVKGKVHTQHNDYWEIRDNKTSPIIKAVNTPLALFVGDYLSYNNFIRALGASNTNSQDLIPVKGPQLLEDLSVKEIADFDVLILSGYNWNNFDQAWDPLEEYVKNGGSLLIDTGAEVKDSDISLLPSGVSKLANVFPMQTSKRDFLGEEWRLSTSNSLIIQDIDFNKFNPLKFDDAPWKLSYVLDNSLKDGAEVILAQAGKPVLVTYNLGAGKVIWSGLNLPYYVVHYQADEEAKLLRQALAWCTGGLGEIEPNYQVERAKAEKIIVKGDSFKGLVFKENFDSGWKAWVNNKKVKVYPAGIDFMFVKVPQTAQNPLTVKLKYKGSAINWLVYIISMAVLIIALKYIVTGNILRLDIAFEGKLLSKIRSWWEKDEAY